MKHKINYLGFLSLFALIGILGRTTGNTGLYGFIGFAYYFRYFWIMPDEYFQLNLQKAATLAFMAEMIALVPFMFICCFICRDINAISTAFGLSFVVAVFTFTFVLLILEEKERRGANYD